MTKDLHHTVLGLKRSKTVALHAHLDKLLPLLVQPRFRYHQLQL